MIELPDVEDIVVALDTETSGLFVDDGARVSVISAAWDLGQGIQSMAWPFDQGPLPGKPGVVASLFDEQYVGQNLGETEWVQLLEWLSRQRLVLHNAKFDLLMLNAGHRVWGQGRDLADQVVWDTMLAQWVFDPTESAALKSIAGRLWGAAERDAETELIKWRKKHPGEGFDRIPWDLISVYAAKDAELCLRLFDHQLDRLDQGEGDLRRHIDLEIEVMRVLCRMEMRGIGYDVAGSIEQARKARELAQKLERELPFRATPAGARKWFYGTQGQMPHCVTEKGTASVGECCVRQLVQRGVEGAKEYQAWTKTTRSISMWYEGFVQHCGDDGRLRTDFKQMGTISMRFSSQRINLQALPHDYRLGVVEGVAPPRSLFMARKGYELWEFDLSQAELRVGTKIAGCRRMRELLETNADVHSSTAEALFQSADFEHRQVAKRANFALIYSVGPVTFRNDVEKHTGVILSEEDSKRVIEDWRSLYPEFPRINRKAEIVARRRGYVKLIDGRYRWFRQHEEFHKAFNAVVQGGIAQFMKAWMVHVERTVPDALLLQIHDSLVLELPKRKAQALAEQICAEGGELATRTFGIAMKVDSKPWHKS